MGIRWLQAKAVMFFDPQGNPSRMVGFMPGCHQAAHRGRRTQQDGDAACGRAQRLEAMGALAGGIAHDFKQSALGPFSLRRDGNWNAARPGSRLPPRRGEHRGRRRARPARWSIAFSRSAAAGSVNGLPSMFKGSSARPLKLIASQAARRLRIERDCAAGEAPVLGDPRRSTRCL